MQLYRINNNAYNMLSYNKNSGTVSDNTIVNKSGSEPFFKPVSSSGAFHGARSASTNSFFIQRVPMQPTATTAAPSIQIPRPRYIPEGSITRQEFDDYVRNNYHVPDIHTGTQQEQEQMIPPPGTGVASVSISNWQTWDPGTESSDYTSIIGGVEDMITSIGSIPNIRSIIFFAMKYSVDASGNAVAQPGTGAEFGGGELVIYQAASGLHHFPIGRQSAGQPVVFEPGSRDLNIRENIVHELGHGVGEAAMAVQNLQTFNLYKAAVGWVGNPPVLYDIGQQAVRDAIDNHTALPSQHIITPDRWNNASVIEQPMTHYSVYGGPSEDLPESVAAYIYQPVALQLRSPHRYGFINNNIASWRSQMQSMTPGVHRPQIGDFPSPTGDTSVG